MFTVTLASGCATNPENLRMPEQVTCINLKEALSTTGRYGLFNDEWTTRLERGPYWSEKIDEKGTFFRAPPGGVSYNPPLPGHPPATDGGFYLPNDPKEPVTIYRYFTVETVPVEVPPAGMSCGDLVYAKDPASQKVSLMSFATSGAVGGAAGGVIGRSLAKGSGMSYGQAAGAGAVGGAVGGLIVASIINAEVGKIVGSLSIQEPQFIDKLRELGLTREAMMQAPLSPTAEASQPTKTPPSETTGTNPN